MSNAKILDLASSIFFFAGFIASKLCHLPFALFSAISNVISLTLFMFGYLFWIVACHLYPDQQQLPDKWYAFAEFKEQNKIAALLGTLGVVLCFAAIASPSLLIPASWLFLVSNISWLTAQIHKYKYPPDYEREYSSTRQTCYIQYAAVMTLLSMLTATSTTIVFLFPLSGPMVLPVASSIGLVLSFTAFNLWIQTNLVEHKRDRRRKTSYNLIATELPTITEHTPEHSIVIDVELTFSPLFTPDKSFTSNKSTSFSKVNPVRSSSEINIPFSL